MDGHQSLGLSLWFELSARIWWCPSSSAVVLSLGVSLRCSNVGVGGRYVLGMVVGLIACLWGCMFCE